MPTFLVTGATGTPGAEVVRVLLGRGQTVRAYVRPAGGAIPAVPGGATAFPGDLRTGAGLAEAAAGADAIIHCATSFDPQNAADLDAARRIIEAARTSGPLHLVHVSIAGIDESAFSYFRGQLAVERAVEASGLPWTILRATQFHGFVLELIESFIDRSRSEIVVPAGLRFQSIDAREVAQALATLAGQEPAGRVPDIGGPEVLTLEQMAEIYTRVFGAPHAVRAEPRPTPSELHDAFRSGANLVPERAVGRATWEEFLKERAAR